jgi:carbonic anhydrase/acetyltransferase-like protein (isoleucine patch superfamily)
MKTVILTTGRRISPFDDPVGECLVFDRPIQESLKGTLQQAGANHVQVQDAHLDIPGDEETLVATDDLWLTVELAKAFVSGAKATGRPSVLAIPEGLLTEYSEALQDLGRATVDGRQCRIYPMAYLPAGESQRLGPSFASDSDGLEPVVVEDQSKPIDFALHKALVPEGRLTFPLTDRAAVRISHWMHILRANHMALTAYGHSLLHTRRVQLLWAFVKAKSLNRWRVMQKLVRKGSGCDVHPTAVVEASTLGNGVSVGAGAVVRLSHLADGVSVNDHAHVSASVLGRGASVSRKGVLQGCVLYPGAETGLYGFQLCIVGRDTFLGSLAILADFKPDSEVTVWHDGAVVSAGTNLLGCAVGHDVRIYMGAVVGPGREIPNGYVILGSQDHVISKIPQGLPRGILLSGHKGVLRPLRNDDQE